MGYQMKNKTVAMVKACYYKLYPCDPRIEGIAKEALADLAITNTNATETEKADQVERWLCCDL